jgi:hypothetical protein
MKSMTAKSGLEARKHRLISRIAAVREAGEIEKLEALVDQMLPGVAIKPLRKNITLDEMLQEQNFTGFDRKELEKLAEAIGITEPIEDLLALLD